MYSPASVKPLSKAQISKLLKGNPVRVMAGQGMKLHLSKPQHKKLAASHKRGGGMNLQLDPYQCQMHAKGGDIFSDMLDGLTSGMKTIIGAAPAGFQAIGRPEVAEAISALSDYALTEKVKGQKGRNRRSMGGGPIEDLGEAGAKFIKGLDRDLPDFMKGPKDDPLKFLYGGTVKEDLMAEYNKIPKQYHSGIESLAQAGLKDLGFGLKKKTKGRGPFMNALKPFAKLAAKAVFKEAAKEVPALSASLARKAGVPQFAGLAERAGEHLAQKAVEHAEQKIGSGRRPMSEAQKAALAKGRAVLAAKRGGAIIHPKHGKPKHKKMSGSALFPAGY